MTSFDEYELSICLVCLHLLANGEFNDGTDAAETAGEGIAQKWGDDVRHLIAGGDDLGFCHSECDTCGDSDYGDRYTATALIPQSI